MDSELDHHPRPLVDAGDQFIFMSSSIVLIRITLGSVIRANAANEWSPVILPSENTTTFR